MQASPPIETRLAPAASPWPRRIVRLLLLLALLLVGLRLWAPALITQQVNRALAENLTAKARLEGVSLSVLAGRATLHGLRIEQPDGFKGAPLLDLPEATVDLRLASLTRPVIVVEEVAVRGLSAHLIRKLEGTNAVLNAAALLKPRPAAPAAPETHSPSPPPGVLVKSLRVERLAFRYEDGAVADEVLGMAITNFTLSVDGLLFDPAGATGQSAGAALARLDARLLQRERPEAVLMASARIGTLSTNIPEVAAVARMVGFSLLNGGPFFKPGLGVALGGESFDLKADLQLAPADINALVLIQMESSQVWPIRITGDPRQPKVNRGALASAVLSRPIKGVENVASNADDAVRAAAGGLSRTVGKGLDGAFRTVGTLGSGLINSAARVANGDVKGAGAALGGTVTGTVGRAVGTVTATGGGLLDSVREAGEAAIGQPDAERWWSTIEARAQVARAEMDQRLAEMTSAPDGTAR